MIKKVSIITVAYNSEATIKDTIESVLNQTYKNIEYIIIDAVSKDKTIDIIKSYEEKFKQKKIEYKWISEKDNGIYDGMNKGIKMSSGEIIGIINSDDWYERDAIEKIINNEKIKNWDMLYCDLRVIGTQRQFIKKAKLTKIATTRNWNHPTTFVKKEVYEEFKYQCKYIYDDLDFMLKVRKKGYKVSILNEIIANFRLGGVSNKKNLKKLITDIKIRNKIYKTNNYSRLYYLDNLFIELGKYILTK